MTCLVYAASIHLAWANEPNHELSTEHSTCILQCTRADLKLIQSTEIDAEAQIVTLVLDVVTDKAHVHLVTQATVTQATDGGHGEDSKYSQAAALQCMKNDDTSGHIVGCDEVASLAAELAVTRFKDPVPHLSIAEAIAPLAERVASLGKELHLLLLGCNTIRLVPALKQKITPPTQACVVVLCTSEVWPSDCSTMLWSLYGHLARCADLDSFRAGTRTLLGEYTDHYKRQRIVDASRAALKLEGSLANAVHCDPLHRVVVTPTGDALMSLL